MLSHIRWLTTTVLSSRTGIFHPGSRILTHSLSTVLSSLLLFITPSFFSTVRSPTNSPLPVHSSSLMDNVDYPGTLWLADENQGDTMTQCPSVSPWAVDHIAYTGRRTSPSCAPDPGSPCLQTFPTVCVQGSADSGTRRKIMLENWVSIISLIYWKSPGFLYFPKCSFYLSTMCVVLTTRTLM